MNLKKVCPFLAQQLPSHLLLGCLVRFGDFFHALHSIGATGQAGLAQVAGPVGEALIMTGLGLAVAIPAVIFYNIATRINKQAIHLATDTAHQILSKIVQ